MTDNGCSILITDTFKWSSLAVKDSGCSILITDTFKWPSLAVTDNGCSILITDTFKWSSLAVKDSGCSILITDTFKWPSLAVMDSGCPILITDTFKRSSLAVTDSRLFPEVLQRFPPAPAYLPVRYQVLNAESAFFLKEANQDLMRNSSLQARTEPFFVHQARRLPSLNASYGPLWVERTVPLELLQLGGAFSSSSSVFTFNWKVQTFVIGDWVYPSEPKVQVLFYVSGRDWDDYSTADGLPCVSMLAFHETQEVRGGCRLRGELGLCVAELQPLPGWFSPPSVVPGRQRAPEQANGTPVELYYVVRSAESGDCSSEDPRKGASARSDPSGGAGGGPSGSSGSAPMRRIGSVRLHQSSTAAQLNQFRLDANFVVLVPPGPIRQRDSFTAFVATSDPSQVDRFTLR